MKRLTKGIRGDNLLCINKMGINKKFDGGLKYLSMTGKTPNLPLCRKIENVKWVGK